MAMQDIFYVSEWGVNEGIICNTGREEQKPALLETYHNRIFRVQYSNGFF
jgi:hypothetical protein